MPKKGFVSEKFYKGDLFLFLKKKNFLNPGLKTFFERKEINNVKYTQKGLKRFFKKKKNFSPLIFIVFCPFPQNTKKKKKGGLFVSFGGGTGRTEKTNITGPFFFPQDLQWGREIKPKKGKIQKSFLRGGKKMIIKKGFWEKTSIQGKNFF
ncbi:hypothetical protein ACFFWB_26875 [Flavobacterium procerum]|uniref:hypothetical protein n=1 Tax=Flavobacterium procerum TaxID=1455569 RepID=UPI0035E7D164